MKSVKLLTLATLWSALLSADRVYVSCQTSGAIQFFDTPLTPLTFPTVLGVTVNPRGICVSPDNTRVYVAAQGLGALVVFNAVSRSIEQVVSMPGTPTLEGIAVTPDGSKVYITNNTGGATTGATGGVFAVDTTTFAVTTVTNTSSSSFRSPYGVVVSPDGTRAYVTNQNSTATRPDYISVIDTATNTVIQNFSPVGFSARGIAISPDGAYLYVANTNEGASTPPTPLTAGRSFSFVDTQTGACSTVQLPNASTTAYNPFSIAVSPDDQTVYLTSSVGTTAPTGQIFIYPSVPAGLTTASVPLSTTSNLNRPRGVVVASDSSEAYFGIFGSNLGDGNTVRAISPLGTLNSLQVLLGASSGPGYLAIGQPPAVQIPVQVVSRKNQFLGQAEVYNLVSWSAPVGITPTEYRIYSDSTRTELLAIVPAAGCPCYRNSNLCPNKTYSYFIVAYIDSLEVAAGSASATTCCCD